MATGPIQSGIWRSVFLVKGGGGRSWSKGTWPLWCVHMWFGGGVLMLVRTCDFTCAAHPWHAPGMQSTLAYQCYAIQPLRTHDLREQVRDCPGSTLNQTQIRSESLGGPSNPTPMSLSDVLSTHRRRPRKGLPSPPFRRWLSLFGSGRNCLEGGVASLVFSVTVHVSCDDEGPTLLDPTVQCQRCRHMVSVDV